MAVNEGVEGGRGGGDTISSLEIVISPLTPHPIRDEAPFLLRVGEVQFHFSTHSANS